MKSKAFPKKKIEKAILAINKFYDRYSDRSMTRDYLVGKKIVGYDEVDAFIARLVGLELVDYSQKDENGDLKIIPLPACTAYFEKKNDVASQAAFAKVTSIISLVISLFTLGVTAINYFWQIFAGK